MYLRCWSTVNVRIYKWMIIIIIIKLDFGYTQICNVFIVAPWYVYIQEQTLLSDEFLTQVCVKPWNYVSQRTSKGPT